MQLKDIRVKDIISVYSATEGKSRHGVVTAIIKAGSSPTKHQLIKYWELTPGSKLFSALLKAKTRADRIVVNQGPPKRYYIFPAVDSIFTVERL